MRKPVFCICVNKSTDRLCGNGAADERICFCCIDSTIILLSIFSPNISLAEQFNKEPYLVANPQPWFSCDMEQFGRLTDNYYSLPFPYEQCHEKTCLRGFQLGPTQTRQMARGLKFWMYEVEDCTSYVAKAKALRCMVTTLTADLHFCFGIYKKHIFS